MTILPRVYVFLLWKYNDDKLQGVKFNISTHWSDSAAMSRARRLFPGYRITYTTHTMPTFLAGVFTPLDIRDKAKCRQLK